MTIKQQLEQCLEALQSGALTAERLRRVIQQLDAAPQQRQDLLYLQAGSTSVAAAVLGSALVQNGEIMIVPDDPDEWPYQTVLDAIRDGWRVIQFPDRALMLDEQRSYGLGCEFILEKWNAAR